MALIRAAADTQCSIPGLVLRALDRVDADEYRAVAARMVQSEIAAGDDREFAQIWMSWGHQYVDARGHDGHHRFGICLGDTLIGRVDLVEVDPPQYGLSYWLDPALIGHGYATASVSAVIAIASGLGAAALYAGVKHDNARSIALLQRLNFELIAQLDTHLRFRLALRNDA